MPAMPALQICTSASRRHVFDNDKPASAAATIMDESPDSPAASTPTTSTPTTTTTTTNTTHPPVVAHVLQHLGLSSYLQTLVDNGFGSWNALLDITEDDLTTLDFKLGHRRALQREIATYRGLPSSECLSIDPISPPPCSPALPSALDTTTSTTNTTLARHTPTPPPREKRKYQRRPRPDPNAPTRPKTGCTRSSFSSSSSLHSTATLL